MRKASQIVLYQTTISSAEKSGRGKIYYGIAKTTFKLDAQTLQLQKNINVTQNYRTNCGK